MKIDLETKKIAIIGCAGSGKSTLAKQIHEITKLPLYHLDKYYWKPNWQDMIKHGYSFNKMRVSKRLQ